MTTRPLVRGPVARHQLFLLACDNAAPAVDAEARALARYEARQEARRALAQADAPPPAAPRFDPLLDAMAVRGLDGREYTAPTLLGALRAAQATEVAADAVGRAAHVAAVRRDRRVDAALRRRGLSRPRQAVSPYVRAAQRWAAGAAHA